MVNKNVLSIIHFALFVTGVLLLWRQNLSLWDMVGNFLFFGALVLASYTDFKERTIPIFFFPIMTLGACLSKFNEPIIETGLCIIIALTFGLVLFGLSRLTSGGIAAGDILILMNFALLYDWQLFLSLTLYATLSAALLGTVMMIFKKWTRRTQLPFAPILAIVFLLNIAINS